ncbi:hypothetical protein [Pandoraea cepalis]|uniref:Transposase n=1 Tax=Pandoraea cepalis TaxID=2508294 RepID=A0A5E4VM31_9BURK|nr:hypothetical protein [Pandoraea cepalis]VVE12963.1 transposase [Pandoraea cepalis]
MSEHHVHVIGIDLGKNWFGKRGNAYLRMMVIQGARALMIHMKRDQPRIGLWLHELEQRSHPHVALIALANKIVRICWKVLTSRLPYRPFPEAPLGI